MMVTSGSRFSPARRFAPIQVAVCCSSPRYLSLREPVSLLLYLSQKLYAPHTCHRRHQPHVWVRSDRLYGRRSMSSHSVEAARMTITQHEKRQEYSHSGERCSICLALLATVLVPVYFLAVNMYSPQYVPVRPWVWAAPGILCILYLFAQFWALLISAGSS